MKLLENNLILTRAIMSITTIALVTFSIGIPEGFLSTIIFSLIVASIIVKRDRIESM